MHARDIDGFFYGLFMDEAVLLKYAIVPRKPRRAYIDNYRLHIGERATLWPAVGYKSYGMVYALTHEELYRLYSGAGLQDYKPEAVVSVDMDTSEKTASMCYNLPAPPALHEANDEYAGKLQIALTQLGFPQAYVDGIL